MHSLKTNPNDSPAIQDLSVSETQYDPNSDAVKGRQGQADELLQRRIQKLQRWI
jgi:hypothetical protein